MEQSDIRWQQRFQNYPLQTGLIDDRAWMKTIEDRNLSSRHYDSSTAEAILRKVIEVYLPLFNRFEETMKQYLES